MFQSLLLKARWYLEGGVRRRAFDWVLLHFERDLTPMERLEFEEWFAADALHQRAFRVTWSAVALSHVTAAEVGREVRKGRSEATPLPSHIIWLSSAVVITATAVALLGLWALRANSTLYATGIGESRSVGLPDGSRVSLSTRSRLRWQTCLAERCVQLLNGEVYFEVAKHQLRPFVVLLEQGVTIRVTGTEFDVHQRPNGSGTDVAVADGTVIVSGPAHGDSPGWTRELHANQQMSVGVSGITMDVHSIMGATVGSWRNGTIDIDDTVSGAICSLAEYLDGPVYYDPRIAEYRFKGRVALRNIPQALIALSPSQITVRHVDGKYEVGVRERPHVPALPEQRCP